MVYGTWPCPTRGHHGTNHCEYKVCLSRCVADQDTSENTNIVMVVLKEELKKELKQTNVDILNAIQSELSHTIKHNINNSLAND